jgi:hypothetical protein
MLGIILKNEQYYVCFLPESKDPILLATSYDTHEKALKFKTMVENYIDLYLRRCKNYNDEPQPIELTIYICFKQAGPDLTQIFPVYYLRFIELETNEFPHGFSFACLFKNKNSIIPFKKYLENYLLELLFNNLYD